MTIRDIAEEEKINNMEASDQDYAQDINNQQGCLKNNTQTYGYSDLRQYKKEVEIWEGSFVLGCS